MNDTTIDMQKKQAEILLAMSPYERFMQGVEMINYVRMVVENSIKTKQPHISEINLKIEVFKRYYSKDLSQTIIEEFIRNLKSRYQQEKAIAITPISK